MKQIVTLLIVVVVLLLPACARGGNAPPRPGAIQRTETVTLPTGQPTANPSPVNTRVLPLESYTPGPEATITPIPDEARGLVVDVIDGDTIAVVMDGDSPGLAYQVRYLGIDAPPRRPDNLWGAVAYATNRKLVGMKVVRLVRDQTDFDSEGFLQRYVYVGDQLMSLVMVEQGLARAAAAPPDNRFQAEIEAAEARARASRLGLWGPSPTLTPTRSRSASPAPQTGQPTAVVTATARFTSTRPAGPTPVATSPAGTASPVDETPAAPAGK